MGGDLYFGPNSRGGMEWNGISLIKGLSGLSAHMRPCPLEISIAPDCGEKQKFVCTKGNKGNGAQPSSVGSSYACAKHMQSNYLAA